MEKPMKMKAAILARLNDPLIVDEVELPDRLEMGQVLVKVAYSGICGSQIGEIEGKKGEDKFLPHLLGHEGSGTVVDIGPGVEHVKTGDSVIMHWRPGPGLQAAPPQYRWHGKKLNAGFVTTFNEYAVVSENRLTSFSGQIPMETAPLMGCAVTTGLGVISNNAKVKIGESVVIIGAGGVGLNMVQGAAMSSAYPIIAVDLYENRLSMASDFGASHTLISKEPADCMDQILEITGASGADVVIDNTGNTEVINMAYKITSAQGRLILVGVPKALDNIGIYSLDLHFGKKITGSHGGETRPEEDIPRYLKLYAADQLKLDALITDRYRLEDINTALEDMKNGKVAGRCLIEM